MRRFWGSSGAGKEKWTKVFPLTSWKLVGTLLLPLSDGNVQRHGNLTLIFILVGIEPTQFVCPDVLYKPKGILCIH